MNNALHMTNEISLEIYVWKFHKKRGEIRNFTS